MKHKKLAFKVDMAIVKLAFAEEDGEWVCRISDEFMTDIENVMDGQIPQEVEDLIKKELSKAFGEVADESPERVMPWQGLPWDKDQ
jgi:flagellar motor component MotA